MTTRPYKINPVVREIFSASDLALDLFLGEVKFPHER
jgi:hypothetical protein